MKHHILIQQTVYQTDQHAYDQIRNTRTLGIGTIYIIVLRKVLPHKTHQSQTVKQMNPT